MKTELYNETHLNISCETFGAHPSPKLKILINGLEVEGETNYSSDYYENPRTRHHLLMGIPKNSSLLECEIQIPQVNYKRSIEEQPVVEESQFCITRSDSRCACCK